MRIALQVFVVLLAASVASGGQAAPAGAISGTVENLTGGRRPVAGQEVKLTAYVNNAEADWKTITTDPQGRFSFAVPTTSDRSYVVNVKYKGGDYDSAPITFKPGESRKQVTMRVYEPTTDPSILRVNVHHMIVEVGQGMVQVAELMVFTNPTDRTYIGAVERADGKRETLRLTLPKGAANVQYMEGLMDCCVFAAPGGLVDTMDVKPGMREIAYSYTIPYARRDLTIGRLLDYPTDRVEVFGSAASQLRVTPLEAMPPVQTDQGTYTRFSSASLNPSAEVAISLSGLPLASSNTRRVALAAFAGIIAAALAYPLLRRRPAPSGAGRCQPQSRRTPETREQLVATIAALDDRFEAGEIAEADYHRQRERNKARLRRLMEREEG